MMISVLLQQHTVNKKWRIILGIGERDDDHSLQDATCADPSRLYDTREEALEDIAKLNEVLDSIYKDIPIQRITHDFQERLVS